MWVLLILYPHVGKDLRPEDLWFCAGYTLQQGVVTHRIAYRFLIPFLAALHQNQGFRAVNIQLQSVAALKSSNMLWTQSNPPETMP